MTEERRNPIKTRIATTTTTITTGKPFPHTNLLLHMTSPILHSSSSSSSSCPGENSEPTTNFFAFPNSLSSLFRQRGEAWRGGKRREGKGRKGCAAYEVAGQREGARSCPACSGYYGKNQLDIETQLFGRRKWGLAVVVVVVMVVVVVVVSG
ncbi:hypothetical protein E2C01_029607 [Portunus trituberculatus]|uniref:Uncharacterized protein n=1 Tax=Portunus trituberculatus TaxID=210409 RepID=A0A5B7ENE2_PORTR|nr:hypothetical protein [Portunus trituberculatus]